MKPDELTENIRNLVVNLDQTKFDQNYHHHHFSFSFKEKSDDIWNFYLDSGFLYEGKRKLLGPYLDIIRHNWEKVVCSDGDAAKIFLLKDHGKIVASSTALQISDKSWMFQHLAVLPEYRKTPAIMYVTLGMNFWAINNQEVENFVTYFQPSTLWAYRTYSGFNGKKLDEEVLLQNYCYFTGDCKGDSPPAKTQYSVTQLEGEAREAALEKMRSHIHPFVINFSGLARPAFQKLKQKYNSLGIRFDKVFLGCYKDDRLIGVAFFDVAPIGLNLSFLNNVLQIVCFDNKDATETIQTLYPKIQEFYRTQGLQTIIALSSEELADAYAGSGFHYEKKYCLFAFSRSNKKFNRFLEHQIFSRRKRDAKQSAI